MLTGIKSLGNGSLSDHLYKCDLGARVTEIERHPEHESPDLLSALAQTRSDATGIDTFQRYIWQAKQAVRLWLTCLSETDNLLFLVCERVEDIALVYSDKVRFLQLKTRDRGSWSANSMCDRGIDALVRSYTAARNSNIHGTSSFELWLEGPISDAEVTVSFCENPVGASRSIRDKIVRLGMTRAWVDDFLQRLIIIPDQPTRAHIDAKTAWELGAIWAQLPQIDVLTIYERLLIAAASAQAASAMPCSIQAQLAAAKPHINRTLPDENNPDSEVISPIRAQILSHRMLIALTPPVPGQPVEQLLARMSAGSAASFLELKMASAGACAETIELTKGRRADMEIQRQMLLASRETAEAELQDLTARVLTVADATARRIQIGAVSNPGAASRPAEAIAADLLSRPADLAQCDRKSLFDRDGYTLYGYVGHLSDVCMFEWRAK